MGVVSGLGIPGISQIAGLLGFKNGGRVPRTGPALLHKGEVVIPASAAKAPRRKKKATRKR